MTNAIRAIKAIEEFGKLYNWPEELVYYLKLRAGHGLFNYGVNSYMEYDRSGYLKEIMDEIADSLVLGVIWADLRNGEEPLKELATLLPMCMEKVFNAWRDAREDDTRGLPPDTTPKRPEEIHKIDLIEASQPINTFEFTWCNKHYTFYKGVNCPQCLNFPHENLLDSLEPQE